MLIELAFAGCMYLLAKSNCRSKNERRRAKKEKRLRKKIEKEIKRDVEAKSI